MRVNHRMSSAASSLVPTIFLCFFAPGGRQSPFLHVCKLHKHIAHVYLYLDINKHRMCMWETGSVVNSPMRTGNAEIRTPTR